MSTETVVTLAIVVLMVLPATLLAVSAYDLYCWYRNKRKRRK